LLALAQVLAFAHVALVAHRICPEHGEALHASHPGETVAYPATNGVFASILPSPGAAVGHDHEHCLCIAQGRERFVVQARAGDGGERLAVAHPWQVSPRPSLAPTLTLFLLAPKGSPPASL
jgi:hypothetical protein